MMKRLFSLLLALCLLLGAAATAEYNFDTYTAVNERLYRIVQRTETEDITLGTGIVFIDQRVLLTVEGCCADGDLYAIGEDGEHAILNIERAGNAGLMLLEMATPSHMEPVALSNYEAQALPVIFGADQNGTTGIVPFYQAQYAAYRGMESLRLAGGEGMLPGAVLMDSAGNLIALVHSQHMEGIGMYNALDSTAIHASMTGDSHSDAFLPVTATWADGIMTVSWMDEDRTDGVYMLAVSAAENVYYSAIEISASSKVVQQIVPPGHLYYMQVQWAKSASEALAPAWNAMITVDVPLEPFTDYGFQQACYLATAPAGTEVTGLLPPMEDITMAALMDAETVVYLQILNTYDVEEEINTPMTMELIAPDGQFYFLGSGYIFSPDYESEDNFALPLTELLNACTQFTGGQLQMGEYIVRYTIGGKLAGEYTFTLIN